MALTSPSKTMSTQPGSNAAKRSELQREYVNVGTVERFASGIGGGALAVYGLLRRDWIGAGLALFGGAVALRGATGHSYVYRAFGINTAPQDTAHSASTSVPHNQGIKVEKVVTIHKSPAEIYAYWHNFENLPRFMQHLKSVTVKDAIQSHWVANAPVGTDAEWDAEVIMDKPNELIAWRSLPGSQIPNAGSVHFTPAPGGRGTEVRVVLEYQPPAGKVGQVVAKLFGEEPEQQVREDLRHFKDIMETGEVATTKGQPSGRSKHKK